MDTVSHMHAFTSEGRATKRAPCPVTGGKHEQDPVMAMQDTFFCRRCGVIPKDSIHYDLREETDGRHDRGAVPGV